MAAPSAMIALLLEMLDVSFDKKAWHRPNMRGSIRLVDARFAALRPAPGRKCVAEHKALRAAVARVDPDDLDRKAAGCKYTVSKTIHGIAAHDVYREGQIQLLKWLLHQPEERI